ncbi:BEN domain-containing protein 6 isoform X2 [Saccopteryx leptura]|uniref:BEN domain-containing protein 6 isoform X2 n=1 Tax=Saccopteryx leptura TaxID=249018 RepID=UPI00339C0031
MQTILQTDEVTNTHALRKGKRKRTETMGSENANSDVDKGQRDPFSGNAFLPGESSSEDEEPLEELSKEELCAKIKSLKQKLTNTRKENSRLRQSLVMLQGNKLSITTEKTILHGDMKPLNVSPISLRAEEEHHTDEKQFKIEKWQIARCNKSKPQKFINDLMQVLYTNEYMATHSLTGAKSSTSREKAVKPAMNQNEVQEIIGVTKQLFPNTDDVSIRRMIGQKLNNCTKKPNLSKNMNSQDIK